MYTIHLSTNIFAYSNSEPGFWSFGSFGSFGSFWSFGSFGSFWGLDSTTARANGCSRSTQHGPSQAGGSALSSQASAPPLH